MASRFRIGEVEAENKEEIDGLRIQEVEKVEEADFVVEVRECIEWEGAGH